MTNPSWSDLSEELQKLAEPARQAVNDGRDVILSGPSGAGKTMVARRLARPVKHVDKLYGDMELAYRLASIPVNRSILWQPFRAPHHTISTAAMIGRRGRPGEVSLAHGGILFLDEAVEFRWETLEAVAHTHREKVVAFPERTSPWIRALPADFILVCAWNNCACGWLGSDTRKCECSPSIQERCAKRVQKITQLLCPDAVKIDLPVRKRMKSEEERRERLFDIAEKLGMTPPEEGYGLRLSRDLENRWWLCGCAEGDCVLPPGRPEPYADKALDYSEKWLANND